MTRIHKKTFLKYTGLFILLAAIIFTPVFLSGKTFIHSGDGFHQHYPFFRQYLNMIRTFFETGNWQSFDWSIGLGQDTLMTYGYYVVGDPFVYLGLLFPQGSEEFAFHAVMFVRIWAVGASFLFYARKMNFSEISALSASVIYAFSHYTIYNVVRHPFFIHPLIFFPLIALGIEKIYRKESGAFFGLIIGLAAISNFYFFYMLTILAVVYAVLRYPSYGKGWGIFWRWFGQFALYYIGGLLLSAVIFLPQVFGFLSASRSPNFPPISLFIYPINYYALLLINTITPGTIFWSVGGLSVISVLTVPFIIRKRRSVPELFWAIALLVVSLLVPLFGSIMNGLSAPYNRFTFISPFIFALVIVYLFENIDALSQTDFRWGRRLLIFFTLLFFGLMFVTQMYLFYLTPLVVGWCAYSILSSYQNQLIKTKTIQRVLLGLLAFNMASNALLFYFPIGKNAITGTEDYGTIDESYEQVFAGVEKGLPKDEWYRVGVSSKDSHIRNHYAWLDINGMNSYASLTHGGLSEFSQLLENNQYQTIQPLRNGIDDRRIANQALGVRYILTTVGNLDYLPSTYDINVELTDWENGMLVAETRDYRPFAYVEQDYVLADSLEELHPVQIENMLERAVFVEEALPLMNELLIPPMHITHRGYFETFDGIAIEPDLPLDNSVSFTVNEKDSVLVLQLDNPNRIVGQEVFLYIEGINYEPFETFPGIQEKTGYTIYTIFNGQNKRVNQVDKYSFSSYFHRENLLVHLNEVTDPQLSLGLQFKDKGDYHFEKVTLVSRPLMPAQAASFANRDQAQALILEEFGDEYVKGSIETTGGLLVTSIPYSKGWTVLVNGEEVEKVEANKSFIGVPLEAGMHEIEFMYETPFLTIGLILTILGVGYIGVVDYLFRKGRDK